MGMLHPIESRLPTEPAVSLLTSAFPLPEKDRQFDRWKTGIKGRNLSCLSATSEAAICRAAGDRYEPTSPGHHEFFPLVTYVPHGCDGFIDDEPRWRVEAEASLKARLPYAIARELWTGAKSGSASLQSTALVSSDEGLTPQAGIAMALSDYEECTQGAMATIHAPSSLIPALGFSGFYKRKGGRLLTDVDHILVPGPGYPQSVGDWGPYETPGDPETVMAAGEGQVWVYVSGHVEVADPHFVHRAGNDWAPRQNRFEVTSEAWTIARFDTCCVFAALVTIPDAVLV